MPGTEFSMSTSCSAGYWESFSKVQSDGLSKFDLEIFAAVEFGDTPTAADGEVFIKLFTPEIRY